MPRPVDPLADVARHYELIAEAMERTHAPTELKDGELSPSAFYARLYGVRVKARILRALIAAFKGDWPDEDIA